MKDKILNCLGIRKGKKLFFLGVVFIYTVSLISCTSTANNKKFDEYKKEKEEEISRLNATINSSEDLEEKVSTLEDEKSDLKKEVEELETEKSKLEKENAKKEAENSKLKKENGELENENSNLQEQNTSPSVPQNYLRIKFWENGKNYKITNEDMHLYKDSYLSEKVEKVIVVSPTISEDRLENGQTVYTVMSNKGLIFMSLYPNIEEIEGNFTAPTFSQDEIEKYLAIKFWQGTYNKKLYVDSNQSWYDDCSLQNSVENSEKILITSENIDHFVMKNGVEVHTTMAEDGSILWMHNEPALETIN